MKRMIWREKLTEEKLVKALARDILINKKLLGGMGAVTDQIHHISVLHTTQQPGLVDELRFPLIRSTR